MWSTAIQQLARTAGDNIQDLHQTMYSRVGLHGMTHMIYPAARLQMRREGK